MARSAVMFLLLVGVVVACGGADVRNGAPAGAGSPPQSGAGGNQAHGGSTTQAQGGTEVGQAGTVSMAGRGGAATGGGGAAPVAGSAGAAGTAGAEGHAGAGGGANVSTPEMLVPTVTAFCAAARACCAQQSDPVMLDDCESGFGARDQTSQALTRGTVSIDATDLAKCLAAYQAAATSCEENSVLDACAGIVKGKVAEGGACTLGVECAGSGPKVCLVTGGQNTPGVCKSVPGGKAGDACSLTCRPNEVCTFTVYGVSGSPVTPCLDSDGLFCDYQALPSKCQPIHALGSACQQDDECGFSAYCDYVDTHTCKKRAQLNEPCGTCLASLTCKDGKCQSPAFTVGSTCDGYSLGPY